jgi:hypothetical protein
MPECVSVIHLIDSGVFEYDNVFLTSVKTRNFLAR